MNAAVATGIAHTQAEPYVNISFPIQGHSLPADHGYLVYSAISRITSNANAGRADVPSAIRVSTASGSDQAHAQRATEPGSSPIINTGSSNARASQLHKANWLAIELISGFPAGRGLITLPDRGATLRLRIPADHYRDVLPLAGKRLDIGGHHIRLGLPVARSLEPAPSLYARVVTIKKFTEPEPFLEAVKRKLDQFGIKGRVELPHGVTQTVSLRSADASQYHLRRRVGSDENSKPNSVPRYRRRIVTIHGKSVVGFSVAVHDLNDEDSLLLQAGAVKVVSSDDDATQWQSIFSRRAMGCGFFNPIIAEQEG